jgi:hypothetical protein
VYRREHTDAGHYDPANDQMALDEQATVAAKDCLQLLQRLHEDIFAHRRGLRVWRAASVQPLTRPFNGAASLEHMMV